jgi:peroxiredoxin
MTYCDTGMLLSQCSETHSEEWIQTWLKDYQRNLTLEEKNSQGNDKWELPIPAIYIIDTDRTILYTFLDTDYTVRLEPSEMLSLLDTL